MTATTSRPAAPAAGPGMRYKGINRRGVAVTGQQAGDPADLVSDYYRRGFRELTVTRGGVIVGAIERSAELGGRQRIWWAES